jgi:sarcosine oxidase subunit gamma
LSIQKENVFVPDFSLTPLSAMGGTSPSVQSIGELTIREECNWSLASVAVRQDQVEQFEASLEPFLDGRLPKAEEWLQHSVFGIFWTAPGQWFVQAKHDTQEDLASLIRAQTGELASITEQNDAWVVFELQGSMEALGELFARLCNVDWSKCVAGFATRTQIDHQGCFVLCGTDESDENLKFHILGPRSSAHSLHHSILAMAKSVS